MEYSYNRLQPANAWAISGVIPMVAGRSYRVEFDQRVLSSSYAEYMKVTLGTAQTVAAQTITLINFPAPGLTNETYINRVSQEYICLQTGNYYLGFNCYSRRDMFALYIDNLRFYETLINEVPSPAVCVSPLNTASNVMIDNSFAWEPQSGNVNGYYFSLGTDNPPTNVFQNIDREDETTFTPANLAFDTTYYWQVTPYNAAGLASDCPIWTFTTGQDPTVADYPYSHSFDQMIPAYGWHSSPIVGTRNWTYSTITAAYPQRLPHSGAGMAYYNVNGAGNGSSAIIVSPPFTADTTVYEYNLSLWMLRELILPSYADKIEIYHSPNPNLAGAKTLLATVHRSMYMEPISEDIEGWHQNTINSIPFINGSANYIIIKAISATGASIYIDDLHITQALIPTPPLPATTPSPAHEAINIALNSSLSWQAGDAETTGYRVYIGTNNPPLDFVNGADVGNVQTYDPTSDFTANTRYYWQIVPYNATGATPNCPVWSFVTIPNPAISSYPYTTAFNQFIPQYWSLQGNGIANWSAPNSSNSGGTAPEASISWTPQFIGISRLVTPSLDTAGLSKLLLSFKTVYSHFGGAFEIGVATRHNFGEWTTVWSSFSTSLPASQIALTIENSDIGYADTQVCFYTSGDSYNMNYWRLDDVIFDIEQVGTPQNLQLNVVEANITLSWDAVPGALGYNVWKSSFPDATFDPVTQVNWQKIHTESIVVTNITIPPEFEKCFFRVTAIK
ncbi:MAG: hypothetical protein CVU48_11250 [Candidatus Cloacimonetes bacterium HGW-Cloacimonetes-1]|nr:MAG: hypothetical protein CVU48_11250 [Candidatus Cloacimonetes bacterium HGW-Cloacimonetes-1]